MRKSGSKHKQTHHAGGACGSIRIAGDGSDPFETEDVIQESIHFPIGPSMAKWRAAWIACHFSVRLRWG